jgi:hypothetical protein
MSRNHDSFPKAPTHDRPSRSLNLNSKLGSLAALTASATALAVALAAHGGSKHEQSGSPYSANLSLASATLQPLQRAAFRGPTPPHERRSFSDREDGSRPGSDLAMFALQKAEVMRHVAGRYTNEHPDHGQSGGGDHGQGGSPAPAEDLTNIAGGVLNEAHSGEVSAQESSHHHDGGDHEGTSGEEGGEHREHHDGGDHRNPSGDGEHAHHGGHEGGDNDGDADDAPQQSHNANPQDTGGSSSEAGDTTGADTGSSDESTTKPQATVTPAATTKPEVSATADPTAEPDATAAPDATEAPTAEPDPTPDPTPTNTPEGTPTATATASATPAATPAPAPAPAPNTIAGPAPAGGNYTGTRLWDAKNGMEAIPADSVGHPTSQGGLGAWAGPDGYSSIEHDYDSTVPCSITASRDRALTGLQSMKVFVGAPTKTGNTNDVARCQPQAEKSAKVGDDLYYGMAVYYDKGWDQALQDILGGRDNFLGGIGQRYAGTGENGPGANLGIGAFSDGPHFRTSINTTLNKTNPGSEIDLGPFVAGQWAKIEWHVRWEQNDTGILEAWRDGVKKGSWTGRTVLTNASPSKLTIVKRSGVYEGVSVNSDRDLYVDNDRICDTYDACDPSK